MTTTLTRLYPHARDAQAAVEEMVEAGVSKEDISLVINKDEDGDEAGFRPAPPRGTVVPALGLGGAVGGGAGLLTTLGALALPGIGPVALALLAATGVVAGATAGGVVERWGMRAPAATRSAGTARKALLTVRIDDRFVDDVTVILDHHHPADPPAQTSSQAMPATSERYGSGPLL